MQKVTNIATYAQPIFALYKGKPVSLIATGDQEGHSPVERFIDAEGNLAWGDQKDFTVVDPRMLPATNWKSIVEKLRA